MIILASIRKALPKDEFQVFNLFSELISRKRKDEYSVNQEAGRPVYRKILNDSSLGVVLVAEDEDKIIGVITLSYPIAIRCSGPYARIEEYIVDESLRGKGIGSMLLDAAISEAKENGCYDLQVNNPSDLGLPLYIKRGFKEGGNYMRLKL